VRADQVWQLGGIGLEFAGLMTVAVGIRKTRGRFTSRPPFEQRAWERLKRMLGRLGLMRRDAVVHTSAVSATATTGGKARATVSLGPWDDVDIAERIERLRTQVERQQADMEELHKEIGAEESARSHAEQRLDSERRALEDALRREIVDAAAGGLGLESFGVVLFLLGLIAQGVGIVLG
jgi:hypothetical protein